MIPRTAFERAETADLREEARPVPRPRALLLPGFRPVRFEFDFSSSEPFRYAGCLLRGSVDRIDVNRGQPGGGYRLQGVAQWRLRAGFGIAPAAAQASGAMLPHKVQTLMYAQVARKVLGLDVVGALYVSLSTAAISASRSLRPHGRGQARRARHRRRALRRPGPGQQRALEASRRSASWWTRWRIHRPGRAHLADGCISPDPRGGDPCGYCPVLACEGWSA